ncbi:MAG TPA: hypothetical protein VNQ31_03745 [Sphingomonadaceae bacterium]|nr:hypothetical protein [Sphingomonadaceae bacterium]
MFDRASEAAARGDCATALPLFAQLAADARIRPGTLVAGAVAARRGICLFATGQIDESAAQLQAALPILKKAGPEFTVDLFEAEQPLGGIALRRWDHDGAVAHYKTALALSGAGIDRVATLVQLAKATAFDGGEAPLGYADEALRLEQTRPAPRKPTIATIHTVKGRILMNQGRNKEAWAELKQALALSGGLTRRVTLDEVAIRSDLAQAALLNGDKDAARLYLAYTGAGRIQESPFVSPVSMVPPARGPETGLTTDDGAVVEFSIGDDGDVSSAQTVYTRGDHTVAATFARAVYGWHWKPEQIAAIPAFYKNLVRVELRCTNGAERISGGILAPIQERFLGWAAPYLDGFDPGAAKIGDGLEKLAALADRAEREGRLPAAVAALATRSALMPGWQTELALLDEFDKALALAGQAKLPAEVVNAIVVFRARAASGLNPRARRRASAAGRIPDGDAALLVAARPELANDALAQDTLLLLSEGAHSRKADGAAILSRVADDGRLADHHPLRQVALLRLADLAAAEGRLDEAQGYFGRTGLTEQQCALIGVEPAMKSDGVSSADYPMEALRYGFGGWVSLEYDIDASGRTRGIRALIAYPPFIFAEAAEKVAQGVVYRSSYRPEGGVACSANRETVRFSTRQP